MSKFIYRKSRTRKTTNGLTKLCRTGVIASKIYLRKKNVKNLRIIVMTVRIMAQKKEFIICKNNIPTKKFATK